MKSWLFRLMFPKQRANIFSAAKRFAAQELESEYRKKFMSMQRSPLDESRWVTKFVSLDRDYQALENEVSALRVDNLYLRRRVKELETK
jgi:hypothetical protein